MLPLPITDIVIRRPAVDDPVPEVLKAYASVTFGGVFTIRNVKVIEGSCGLFLSMPAHRNKSGGFSDIVHPVSAGFREALEAAVLAVYRGEEPPESLGVGAPVPRPPKDGECALARRLEDLRPSPARHSPGRISPRWAACWISIST